MTDSTDLANDPSNRPQGGPAGDDLLPPVEPPSAGFIVQLFVVPALIVLVIVSVWLTFSWLVRRASPATMVQGLEQGPSVARWQRASELADMLRNKRYADFKRDAKSAEDLARILDREIDQAGADDGMQDEDLTLRYFLARALGEFEVNEGIGVLLKAAETERNASEQLVRRGALEAIAVRAYNLRQLQPPQELTHPELYPTLAKLASDETPTIRSQVAYTLGQLGTPEAIKQLEAMVDDPDADTRFNAAVGLAHHGNQKAAETLAEMLDLEELANLRTEAEDPNQAYKRSVIVGNALQAIETMANQNPSADYTEVMKSLEQLADAKPDALKKVQLPSRVTSDARRLLEFLQSQRAEAPGDSNSNRSGA